MSKPQSFYIIPLIMFFLLNNPSNGFCFIIILHNIDTVSSGIDTTKENMVYDELFKLPEVKKLNKIIDSVSNHKHSVSLMILGRPTKKYPYYQVQAGYNNEYRFEPMLQFHVNSKDLSIKVLDTISGEFYDLEEWRKRNKE